MTILKEEEKQFLLSGMTANVECLMKFLQTQYGTQFSLEQEVLLHL